ncbi:MAG: cobalamin B12-binding domain-containing protein [Caldilineae bacterium]|nr:cobalamin B12-binding domain-containing protein [Caldilineae bacterium]
MTDIMMVNFRNERDMYPPFGIMYVADALMQEGYSVQIWHEEEDKVDEFVRAVERERPLWVGFSTITGPQLKATIDATKRVHELGITTVWGGVHATIMPEEVLRECFIDFVVINEGEVTAQEFTRELGNGRNWAAVRGLAWKDAAGQPVVNMERPFIQNLDDFSPRWDLLADVEAYLLQSGPYDRAIPVYISRGCPFRCAFCYNEIVMKRTWRQHSDQFIVDQINWLKKHHGINAVDYADDYLFGRIKPMQRLVEKVNMPWSGQVRVQLLKPEFIRWMVETGCQWVNIGAESGSQAVLDSIAKDQKAEWIEIGVRNLAEHAPHIEANLSFIVGLPEEGPEERRITLELIDRLCRINANARCSVCVYMPYPGTPLWPDALSRGYVPPDNQEGWAEFDLNRGNTPWVSESEASAMCEINDILYVGRSQGHWLLKPYYGLLRWRWMNQQFGYYWEGPAKRAGGRLVDNVGPLRAVKERYAGKVVTYNANTHKSKIDSHQAAM